MAKKRLFAIFVGAFFLFSSISIYAYAEAEKTAEDDLKTKMQADGHKQEQVVIASAAKETAVWTESESYKEGLAAYIKSVNGSVSDQEAEEMAAYFVEYGDKYNVDEKLVMAIAHTESTYYTDAVSCTDYKGLMQTGDILAEEAGYSPEELFDPEVSIDVGASYIGEKLEEFGDTKLALTAYNQGSGSVYSGNYTTGYAETAMARAEAVEAFLIDHGYIGYQTVE